MIRYGIDFAMRFNADGTIGLDFATILNETPIIVVQRVLSKILANPGDYWWLPTAGCGLFFTKGVAYEQPDLDAIRSNIIEQCRSDPQVDDASCEVTLNSTGELSITPTIQVNRQLFTPNITIAGRSVSVAIGGVDGR